VVCKEAAPTWSRQLENEDIESRYKVEKLAIKKPRRHAVIPGYLFDKRFRKPFPLFRLRGGNKPGPPQPGNVIADLFAVLFHKGFRGRSDGIVA
jgi:hypothetical protein